MSLRRCVLGLPALVALAGCVAPPAATPAAMAAARPAIPRLPPPATIAELIGDAPDRVIAALGEPILRRRDGDAESWLYEGTADCRLDLVFYRTKDTLKLVHARARAKAETACLQQVAALPPQ